MEPKKISVEAAARLGTQDDGARVGEQELARALPRHTRVQLPPLTRVARGPHAPTSFAQSKEWFLQQLEGEAYGYNLSIAIRLQGELQLEAVQQSINEIIRRHESLRTHFVAVDGQPVQVIEPKRRISLSVIDLQGLSAAVRDSEVRRLARLAAQHSFNLAQGPLLRAGVLKTASNEHILLLIMHHIITDGWSKGILARELDTLYSAFASGQSSPLAELTIQYADFACWQRQWLDGPVLDIQLAYWKDQLPAAPAM